MTDIPIQKLVAQEFEVEEEETITFFPGHKYVYLVDPETGSVYEPIPGWEVTGYDLRPMFREIPSEESSFEES